MYSLRGMIFSLTLWCCFLGGYGRSIKLINFTTPGNKEYLLHTQGVSGHIYIRFQSRWVDQPLDLYKVYWVIEVMPFDFSNTQFSYTYHGPTQQVIRYPWLTYLWNTLYTTFYTSTESNFYEVKDYR